MPGTSICYLVAPYTPPFTLVTPRELSVHKVKHMEIINETESRVRLGAFKDELIKWECPHLPAETRMFLALAVRTLIEQVIPPELQYTCC